MNLKLQIRIFFLLFLMSALAAWPKTGKADSRLFLFADREFCVSGDTVWFKVAVKNGEAQKSNVVHIQLTNSENRLISEVITKSEEDWAEGFLPVPDSLSSGVYFLSAFLYEQLTVAGFPVTKKTLFVYNRFQKELAEFSVPSSIQKIEGANYPVAIKPDKTMYKQREKVQVHFDLEAIDLNEVTQVIVRAHLVDELAVQSGGYFHSTASPLNYAVKNFEEKDGFILSGKVTDSKTGQAGGKVVVLLSLINDPQYLDYCVSDQEGFFHFFLKDAVGEGEIVMQAVSEDSNEWEIMLNTHQFVTNEPVLLERKMITPKQSKFIDTATDGAFFEKLFNETYLVHPFDFFIPQRFNQPVYGYPYKRVVPAEFYDLPDFQEISRELLHGVQYREKDGLTTLRLLDLKNNAYFKNEPFKLVNGIPVFSNRQLNSFGSTDIDYIEYVLEDRVFGDLRFNGILAVYLNDTTNYWLARFPNFFRFSVPFLQPARESLPFNRNSVPENIPDLRTVNFWQLMETGELQKIEFFLSDRKGKVEISVEGFTEGGRIFKTSEIIDVR
jgi:hypothetical protein